MHGNLQTTRIIYNKRSEKETFGNLTVIHAIIGNEFLGFSVFISAGT